MTGIPFPYVTVFMNMCTKPLALVLALWFNGAGWKTRLRAGAYEKEVKVG